MPIPEWADEQLSRDLPTLRARGEGQDLEYKETFPRNVSDLAKEIAAFATTNTGTILIGVSDAGDLVGLPDTNTVGERDQLLLRVQGICRGTVKPAITPVVKWAVENNAHVLVLLVPRGSQPVYYSNNIAYVRHLTEARPAEPHEVIERIRDWLPIANLGVEERDPYSEFLGRLASALIDVLIYADQADEREINPWLDMWRSQYEYSATELRAMANEDIAIDHGIADRLNELADALDAVAHFRLFLGCAPQFDPLKARARELAAALKADLIDTIPLSEASVDQVREVAMAKQRQLLRLTQRMPSLVEDGRIEDVQSEASEIGHTLLRLGYYNLDALGEGFSERLKEIAKDLHLVETAPLYMDGGASMRAIMERVNARSDDLAELVRQMETGDE